MDLKNVSIVIPTCERPRFLSVLLKSIEEQTHTHFEVIIVDDCSSQIEWYGALVQAFSSLDISYYRNAERRGASHSRNRGIKAAQYDLIALVDDDDVWLPTKLANQVPLFSDADPTLGLVYTWADLIGEHGNRVGRSRSEIEGDVVLDILKENFFALSTVLAKKKALFEAGLFDEKLVAFQDWDMWTRIFTCGFTCKVLKSVEVKIGYHYQDSISSSVKGKKQPFEAFCQKHKLLYEKYMLSPQVDPVGKRIP